MMQHRISLLVPLALASALGACEGTATPPPSGTTATTPSDVRIEAVGTTLGLLSTPLDAGRVAVDLLYAPREGQVAPRMMELHLRLTGGLDYVEAQPLAALTAAGKELVVQPQGDAELRVIAYAANNTKTIAGGALARFVFQVASGPGSVAIDGSQPVFAPAEANVGVTLGAAVTVGGAP